MMRIVRLICILFLPICLFGQKTKLVLNYFEVDEDTIREIDKNCIVKERFYVLKRNKRIKHGNYQRYNKLNDLLEQGEYENGKKKGIWHNYKEKGFVLMKYDYDKNVELVTVVLASKIFKYPYRYLDETTEEQTNLKEGKVVLNIGFDEDCNLKKVELAEKSYIEFNQISIVGFKEYMRLKKKYNLEIDLCKENRNTFEIKYGI